MREAAEGLLQMLGLHYRVVEMATGELGNSAHRYGTATQHVTRSIECPKQTCRKYDIEAWMPGRQNGDQERVGKFGEGL